MSTGEQPPEGTPARTREELVRELRFYGELERRFGARHRLAGRTLPELILALDEQRDGAVRRYLYDSTEKQRVGFRVWIDGEEVAEDQIRVLLPGDCERIEIMPYPLAAKGALQIIIGVLLIIVGGVLMAFGQEWGWLLVSAGLGMLTSGIASLLVSTPSTDSDSAQGFAFTGGIRILGQGEPKPVVWGRCWASGGAISASSRAVEPDDKYPEFYKNAERRMVDLVSEGEIEGWADPDFPEECIALDDTLVSEMFEVSDMRTRRERIERPGGHSLLPPVLSSLPVQWDLKRGDPAQTVVSFAPAPEFEVQVGTELLQGKNVVRSTTPGSHLAAVRINLQILALIRSGSSGQHAQDLGFTIRVTDTGGTTWKTTLSRFWDARVEQPRNLSYEIKVQGEGPWSIEVQKTTKDTEGSSQRACYFQSFTEISSAQLRYQGSAVVGIKWRASEFAGSPNRLYLLKGVKCRVPSNYDPETRTYDAPGTWDGTFKAEKAWTDNPIWQVCEYLTNRQFGLGTHFTDDDINWYSAFRAARTCDEQVDDLRGGTEPRHSYGAQDVRGEEAWRKLLTHLASAFCVPYSNGHQLHFLQDRRGVRRDVVTPEMVKEGRFEYTGTPLATMLNRVSARWASEENLDRDSVEVVEEPDLIRKFGLHQRDVRAAGIRSRSEVIRLLWNAVLSEKLQGAGIAFTMGPHAESYRLGDVIGVMDPTRGAERFSGLLVGASTTAVDLDHAVELKPGKSYALHCAQPAFAEKFTTSGASGATLVLTHPLAGGEVGDESKGLEFLTVRQDLDADGVYETERTVRGYVATTQTVTLGDDGFPAALYPTLVEYFLPMFSAPITNAPGTTAKLTLAAPFNLPPEAQFAWAVCELSTAVVDYRVLAIERKDDSTLQYDVTCVRYSDEKYDLLDALPQIPVIDSDLLPIPALGSIVPPPSGATLEVQARPVAGQTVPVLVVRWGEPNRLDPNYHAVMGYEVRLSRDGETPWVLAPPLHTGTEATLPNPDLGTWSVSVRAIDVERRKSRPATAVLVYDDSSDVHAVGEIAGLRIEGAADGITSESRDFTFVWEYRQPGAADQGEVTNDVTGVQSFVFEVYDLRGRGLLRRRETGLTRRFVYSGDDNRADQAALGRSAPAREVRVRCWARGFTGEDGKAADGFARNPARVVPAKIAVTATGAPPSAGSASRGMVHVELVSTGESPMPPDAAGWAAWGSTTPGFTPAPEHLKLHVVGSSGFASFPADPNVALYVVVAQLDSFNTDPHLMLAPAAECNLAAEEAITPDEFVFAQFPVETDDIAPDAVTEFATIESTIAGETPVVVEARGGKLSVMLHLGLTQIIDSNGTFSTGGRVKRIFAPAAVRYFNGSSYVDYTAEAASETGTDDVAFPNVAWTSEASQCLYIGNPFPWFDAALRLELEQAGGGFPALSSAFVVDYWNGSAWIPTGLTDTTDGAEQSGYLQFASGIPGDWAPRTVNGGSPLYFIRLRQTQNPAGSNLQAEFLRIEHQLTTSTPRAICRVDADRFGSGLELRVYSDSVDIEGTFQTETLILEHPGAGGCAATLRMTVFVARDKAGVTA